MPHPLRHPPHLYLDDTWYFITTSTYQKRRLFQSVGYKEILRDQLKTLISKFEIKLAAWVILDNHYHILTQTKKGRDLSKFISELHGRTSFEINRRDRKRGGMVWHNYWDTCIRGERDAGIWFNYIHHNPVKHGYAKQMQDWEFSSYRFYLERKGEEWLMDSFIRFPIIDYTDARDSF